MNVFIVNKCKGEKGKKFQELIVDKVAEKYTTSHLLTNELLFDVNQASKDAVTVVSDNKPVDLSDSFFLYHSYGSVMASSALLTLVLRYYKLPFNDPINHNTNAFGDKAFFIVRAATKSLPVPRTLVATYTGVLKNLDYIESELSYPFVFKGKGSRGDAVQLVQSSKQFSDIIQSLEPLSKDLFSIQAYIENTYDIRALFFRQNLIGAISRHAPEGEFLNNISSGGSGYQINLSIEEIKLCQSLQKMSDVDLAGIDFIRTGDGIQFIEVNRVPQLEGISSIIPDLDVASHILDYISDTTNK